MRPIKFDVFGHHVLIARTESGWQAFYGGEEGKRRPAHDIIIPSDISEQSLEQHLADLCHEWATDENLNVKRIE